MRGEPISRAAASLRKVVGPKRPGPPGNASPAAAATPARSRARRALRGPPPHPRAGAAALASLGGTRGREPLAPGGIREKRRGAFPRHHRARRGREGTCAGTPDGGYSSGRAVERPYRVVRNRASTTLCVFHGVRPAARSNRPVRRTKHQRAALGGHLGIRTRGMAEHHRVAVRGSSPKGRGTIGVRPGTQCAHSFWGPLWNRSRGVQRHVGIRRGQLGRAPPRCIPAAVDHYWDGL